MAILNSNNLNRTDPSSRVFDLSSRHAFQRISTQLLIESSADVSSTAPLTPRLS
ncbi:unnamed protein product [Brassica oleracea var. botrytis]